MDRIGLIRALALLLISTMGMARDADFLGLDSFGTDEFLNFDAAMAPEVPLPPDQTPLLPGGAPPLPSEVPVAPSPETATPLPPDTPAAPTTPSTPETPLLPPATPQTPPLLPPATPSTPLLPPETPLPPVEKSCDEKCAEKCTSKIPIVFLICFKPCKVACNVFHAELAYNCTDKCAKSMPASVHSDKEKMGSYVNSCYEKCKSNGVF